MTEREIIEYIDSGANFYISMFGNAEHMEMVNKECYTYIKPNDGEHGITFVYNIHMEHLPTERQKELVAEIKALDMPIWLDLLTSDALFFLFFGKNKIHGQTEFADDDEVYLALLPDEKTDFHADNDKIIQVQSAEDFALWAQVTNNLLAGGYPDMHPVYHYPLCKKGFMKCYIMYHNNVPVSVASTMNNHGIVSLEFVATIPEMRRQGFAKSVCEKAVNDALADGAKIITVRAANAAAGRLYQAVGFQAYNYVL